MPYYKNIGTCEMKYHGVSIQPNKVKFFEKSVMDNNLMQVVPEAESALHESSVRKKRSYNRKNLESMEEATTSKSEPLKTVSDSETEISSESKCD